MLIMKVITPDNLDTEFDVAGPKISLKLGMTLTQTPTGFIDLDPSLAAPDLQVTLLNQIGLTAQLAAAGYGLEPLTYSWSATGPGVATFATPAATTTSVVFDTPGTYLLTLMATDSQGVSATTSLALQVDRVLYVNGVGVPGAFTKLQAAFDWLNLYDPANAASYRIEISGTTLDTARVVPNAADVHFQVGALLPVGVDFGGETYRWSADGMFLATNAGIVSTSGPAITAANANTNLRMENLPINCTDPAAAAVVQITAGTRLMLFNCFVSSPASPGGPATGLLVDSVPIVVLRDCQLNQSSSISNASSSDTLIIGCSFNLRSSVNGLALNNVNGALFGNRFRSSGAFASDGYQLAVTPSQTTRIVGNHFDFINSTGVGVASAIRINGTGAAGKLRIEQNSIINERINGIGIHLVGTPTTNWLIANNTIEGILAAALSSSDTAGAAPVAWAAAPFYNNLFKGAITNITFAAGTPLNGDNVQV